MCRAACYSSKQRVRVRDAISYVDDGGEAVSGPLDTDLARVRYCEC